MTNPGEESRVSAREAALRRLKWRSRRGLRENDLVLERFFGIHARDLDDERMARLGELLALEDGALWDLISGRSDPEEPHAELVGWMRGC